VVDQVVCGGSEEAEHLGLVKRWQSCGSHRVAHMAQPGVALGWTDAQVPVPLNEPTLAPLGPVDERAAEVLDQEQLEMVPGALHAFRSLRVQRAEQRVVRHPGVELPGQRREEGRASRSLKEG
jgi:hypothetical protein